MVNWSILTPSLISIIVIISLNIVLFFKFRQLDRTDLNLFHIPFLSILVVPTGYLGMALFESVEYEFINEIFFQVCFTLIFLLASNVLFLVIYRIIEKPYSLTLLFINIYNGIFLPIIFLRFVGVEFVDGGWEIVYDSPVFFYMAGFGFFIYIIGINLLLLELLISSPYRDLWVFMVILDLFALISIISLVFRDPLGLAINFWTVPISLMFVMFSLIVIRRPDIFLTSSVPPKFLMIMDKKAGITIRVFHFIPNSMEGSNDLLFTGALSAIQSIMEESLATSDRIKYLGIGDTHLTLEHRKKYEFILGSEKQSRALDTLLRRIVTGWDFDVEGHDISDEMYNRIHEFVYSHFIHQIRRLDLFIAKVEVV